MSSEKANDKSKKRKVSIPPKSPSSKGDQISKFCKVFELEDTQVLMKWTFDPPKNEYELSWEFACFGIRAKPVAHFEELHHCLASFNMFDKEDARELVQNFGEMLREQAGQGSDGPTPSRERDTPPEEGTSEGSDHNSKSKN